LRPNNNTPRKAASRKKAVNPSYARSGDMMFAVMSKSGSSSSRTETA
jgi:hypothetical protein